MILTWSARAREETENDLRESCWNPRRPNTILDMEMDIVGLQESLRSSLDVLLLHMGMWSE
jgi:hypothetical protein